MAFQVKKERFFKSLGEVEEGLKAYELKKKTEMEALKQKLLKDKTVVEAYEVNGRVVQIFPDDNPEDPRNWDNLGVMAAFHKRYTLGDKTETDINSDNFGSWNEMQEYIVKEKKAAIILPLYLYDHSGLRMKVGSFAGLLPQGHAEFDSGQVGFIYVTQDTLNKVYGKLSQKQKLKKAEAVLREEVKTYDQYLAGDVYGYRVTDLKTGEDESVWGFFGMDDVKDQAEASAKSKNW